VFEQGVFEQGVFEQGVFEQGVFEQERANRASPRGLVFDVGRGVCLRAPLASFESGAASVCGHR